MENVKIVIVEDEFVIAEDIGGFLSINDYCVSGVYTSGEEALKAILQSPPDLMLVDIQLAGTLTGIDLVLQLKSQLFPIIYITANSDKATLTKAISTSPHAFLIKPFCPKTLLASIDLALFNFSQSQTAPDVRHDYEPQDYNVLTTIHRHLFIRVNGRNKKIRPESILFAQANGSYTNLYTEDGQYTLSQNLSQFSKKCLLADLIRVHRSFVVNLTKVDAFDDTNLFIKKVRIPVSESHRAGFMSRVRSI